ncbi:MAG: hypothetical protein NVV67_03180 [Pseudoxanthomonas sp.]|nr:hypothetical protein [Pseudoxanthomonas sp.]
MTDERINLSSSLAFDQLTAEDPTEYGTNQWNSFYKSTLMTNSIHGKIAITRRIVFNDITAWILGPGRRSQVFLTGINIPNSPLNHLVPILAIDREPINRASKALIRNKRHQEHQHEPTPLISRAHFKLRS